MKIILTKIFFGFLFGVGFSIAMFGTGFILEQLYNVTYVTAETAKLHEVVSYDEDAKLVITSHSERIIDNSLIIIGTFENQGKNTWKHIQLEAEMYDDQGNFINECIGSVSSKIAPSQSENFKIKFSSECSYKSDFPEYKNIVLKIKDARGEWSHGF